MKIRRTYREQQRHSLNGRRECVHRIVLIAAFTVRASAGSLDEALQRILLDLDEPDARRRGANGHTVLIPMRHLSAFAHLRIAFADQLRHCALALVHARIQILLVVEEGVICCVCEILLIIYAFK